ncbi:DUF805 domain-containing protein [Pseudomonas sp. ZM23]|uniref:DUF805 domain-containing protein n=1 Tax=Pseudomonas triclosanedens TaxID=2961893 RepID=A0ABY6ZZJ6_9PSED|nr:DUF805 domain-containing protein [Pseudomonas triclosanedens]MCP8463112.1 DUF805 domain-containing protein [Pseudomonas triclosanedens]MCP8468732.1 DUF805 domain-containing protein [Pseudomonas triclosanedens]MCP8475454.1 DUF805 domain-containing protein [Pseudomonas triclosanedens]WAI50286.1 DUF805 domain-containing protein [Pseudomonas triclosanedens]
MEQPRFKIVFDGALMPQTPLETAKENLARLFKSDTSKIDALFSGNPVVLKRDLSDDEADKYLRALHGAGANARKEADVAASLSLVETEDHPSEETLAARAAGEAASNERMTCPKCGHEQPKSIECVACGIIIEKYLARQAELAASAPPAAAAAPTASPYAPPQAQVGDELPEFGELKPFAIDGRIGRVRYLGWTMALFLIFMPVIMLTLLLGMASEYLGIGLAAIATIAYLVFSIRISIQRLHDIGWTGWLLLLYLVPVVGSVFPLLILLIPGTVGANRYGPPPPPNSRGVVVLAWTTLILPVLGILAAISIPAYQQYIERAQSAQTQQYQRDDSAASAEPSDEFNSGDTEGAESDAEPSDSEAQ